MSRDRDTEGRPRNARPRDALGRPLGRGAAGEPRVADDLVLAPAATLAEAQRLIDADRPFHAHEVLEARWKASPDAERDLWQGLARRPRPPIPRGQRARGRHRGSRSGC